MSTTPTECEPEEPSPLARWHDAVEFVLHFADGTPAVQPPLPWQESDAA